MAKLTGPLFSLTARNTIGKALTYSSWRGIPYVRTRVIPANPQSVGQSEVRGVFRTLAQLWNRMGALAREPWELDAAGKPYTNRNRLIGINVPLLQGTANMTAFKATPGTGGALPPLTAVGSSPGAGALTITATQPTLPTGWTQLGITGLVFLNTDPSPYVDLLAYEAEDAVTPFTIVLLTALPTGTYYWATWNVLQAPDLSTRCSPHLDGTQAVA